MLHLRLSSDYLPNSDYSDYLVVQFQDAQDACSTTVAALSTRAIWPFPVATMFVANASTSVTAASSIAAASSTAAVTATTTTTSSIMTPTPTQAGMVTNCNKFQEAVSGDGCYSIATSNDITLADFELWNPAVGQNCAGLFAGYYYCVAVSLDSTSSACQMINTSIGVTSSNATIACNQLLELYGVITGDLLTNTEGDDCYSDSIICLPPPCELMQVPQGTTCDSIAASLSANSSIGDITTTQLLSWNPNILGTCDNLTTGQYICSNVPGGTYVPPPTPTNSSDAGGQERGGPGGADPTAITGTSVSYLVTSQPLGSNPTAAPAPTQAGIAPNCNEYAQAVSGDSCSKFASDNNITPTNLYAWNSVLGAAGVNCNTELFSGYYYCIGVQIAPTTTIFAPPATSTVVVPSPTQTGIIPSCNLFAEAVSGDYCSIFAQENDITSDQLYTWNTVLGANGANCNTEFWAGYYYCVGVPP
ncbi:hypothetical protein MMC25_001473 [Agyrium rufum]|nr:hypothetical protein [Agyrium rufum]